VNESRPPSHLPFPRSGGEGHRPQAVRSVGEVAGRAQLSVTGAPGCPECGAPVNELAGSVVVYLAPIPWGYLWQRPQQLTSRLAAHVPVLYIQPEGTKSLGRLGLGRVLRRLRLHLRGAGAAPSPPGLEILAPPFLPIAWGPLGDRLNAALIGGAMRRVLRRRPAGAPPVLWCTRPTDVALRLARSAPHARVVYELLDAIPPSHPRAGRLGVAEAALLGRADLVVCTSEALMAHARQAGTRPHLVPNGVDPGHFADASRPAPEVSESLAALAEPVVGCYGTLAEWIDFPLLAALADGFPGVTFALIGPVEVPPATLPQRPNLRWIGPQPYPTLPAWLARFTVCLLPFRVDGFTRAINPVKLYEYLATGKPVVSTPLPEVLAFGDLVYVGSGLDGVAGALRAALAERDRPDLAARRRAAAAANTWDQRVGRVVHLLHTLPPS